MQGQLNNLIMIQIWDHFKKWRLPLDILFGISWFLVAIPRRRVNKELSQIALFEIKGWEEFFFDERLGATDFWPAVFTQAPTLNTEELTIVNNSVGLTRGELE